MKPTPSSEMIRQRNNDNESGYTAVDTGQSKLVKRYGKKIFTGPYQTVRYKNARSNTKVMPTKGFPNVPDDQSPYRNQTT